MSKWKQKLLEVAIDAKNLGATVNPSLNASYYLNLGITTILWPNIHILEHDIGVDT